MTRAEKAQELASQIRCTPNYRRDTRIKLIEMAEWADKHPSDETIMRILNCIGYEERSWIEFVRKNLKRGNDMEHIKSTASGEMCGDNRFDIISRAKEDILKSTNISSSPEELEVLDNFLFRCWQMGWLNEYANFNKKL